MGVMDLRRNILLNEPHVSTAVGNPVAFTTDVKGLLQQARFDFLPVQSGTGDPSPSNVRPISGWTGVTVQKAGKNLFDKSAFVRKDGYYLDGNETPTEATSSVSGYGTNYIPVSPSTMYIISGETRFSVYFYTKSRTWIRRMEQAYNTPFSFTTPNDCYYIQLQYRISDLDVNTIQLEVGNSNTPYSPYSGTTIPVTFPAVGKNLLNDSKRYVSSATNVYIGSTSTTYDIYLEAGTYTVSADFNGNRYGFYYQLSGGTGQAAWYSGTAITVSTITLADSGYYRFWAYRGTGDGGVDNANIKWVQIEKGSTATTYEPYTNTVYGGHIDLVTGELVETWRGYYAKDLTWITTSQVQRGVFRTALPRNRSNASLTNIICNEYQTVSASVSISSIYFSEYGIKGNETELNYIYIRNKDYTDLESFVASLDGVFILVELLTPINYQLTPQQISALTGNNTIWADTNGDATIKFWSH